jgi:hypothetical protein
MPNYPIAPSSASMSSRGFVPAAAFPPTSQPSRPNSPASGAPMADALDLFGLPVAESYPIAPGHKGCGTSREAARRIHAHARTLRDRILAEFVGAFPLALAADEVADRTQSSILSARPRCSELRAAGLIESTPERRLNPSGMSAVRWRATPAALSAEVA